MTLSLANAPAIVGLDAILGEIGTSGLLRFYDGTVPTDCDTALSGNTLLATCPFSATAFAGATDGTGKATASANSITADSSADATGTATFWRALTSGAVAKIQGSVTATSGGGDIELNTTSIVAGGTVTVTSLVIELPELGS